MSHPVKTEFGKWQRLLWPVHRSELKKLIPMLLIFFFISFNYNVLRTMKDSLIVTAKSSGAEVIPFIKVWVMFPMAVVLTFAYTRLANRWPRETVFYIMMTFFLAFFLLFLFLYPFRDFLHPHATADLLQKVLPEGFRGAIAMYRYWTFTSFYVMAELWGAIMLFTLFWGFANQITRVEEAKRFYGLFGIGANLSGVFAGMISMFLITYAKYSPLFFIPASERWLYLQIFLILVSGVIVMGIFRWMHKSVLSDARFYDPAKAIEDRSVRGKLSLRDSFAYLGRSRYLLCITIIVIAYNVVINLVEVVWKHQVRELYPNKEDYTFYMNQVMFFIGIVATGTALFGTGNFIRRYGWTFTAMLTPATLLITSVLFFYFFFCKEGVLQAVPMLVGFSTPALVVFLGSLQNCVSRAAKYTVFDSTKELAFVPLSSECKLKGKAAIDGVCSRLGKSGGSVIHQGLLLFFSTIVASAPYVAAWLIGIIVLWIIAVYVLGKQFNELTEKQGQSAATPAQGPSLQEQKVST
ncbi:MAG: Npt1/Npt2 family nucleotide transporter [Chlamydiales bacterium]|nr:Npt1/Npt2 family nucleotide transporter [Chlamydiales bacterium]